MATIKTAVRMTVSKTAKKTVATFREVPATIFIPAFIILSLGVILVQSATWSSAEAEIAVEIIFLLNDKCCFYGFVAQLGKQQLRFHDRLEPKNQSFYYPLFTPSYHTNLRVF